MSQFLAANSHCEVDSDCVIVGDCSGGFGFYAVNAAAREEGEALSLDTPAECGAFDGPLYHAVCEEGTCGELETGDACGTYHEGPSGVCPDTDVPYVQSCALAEAGDLAIDTGCHRRCGEGGASVCPAGFACQAASGCAYGYGGGGVGNGNSCTECEPSSVELCVPDPACEVVLELDFAGEPSAWFGELHELTLTLSARNVSDAEVTISIAACASPELEGLGDYDAFELCAAGACVETEPREITLLPSQRMMLAQPTLRRYGSSCNDDIADGDHTITFSLPDVTGAQLCGSAPVALHVRP